MKIIGIFVCFFVLTLQLIKAQTTTNTTNKGENFIKQIEGKIDKAKLSIDKTCADINGSKNAENWYLKGYVYVDLAKSEVYAKLAPNAAIDALKAIEKCKELDVDKKFESDCINLLFELSTLFYNKGINAYNSALKTKNTTEFSTALINFEYFFESIQTLGNDQAIVNHLIELNNINKNSVIVYTGYSAQQSGDNEKAKKFYSQVVLLNETNDKAKLAGVPLGYIYYSDLLISTGDTNNAKKVIEKGAKLYADNPDILMAAIDIFSKAKKVNEMADFLQTAVQNNPTNAKMLVVLAGAFNNIAKDYLKKGYKATSLEYRDKAIKTYEKTLSLKVTDKQLLFNINFNLGVLYYNPAVNAYKARNESNQQEYEFLFKKAVPYLETARKYDPENHNIMTMLMKAYQTLNETAKAEAIEKELYK
jgi:tetratricopeptide (TPR) repeat protein